MKSLFCLLVAMVATPLLLVRAVQPVPIPFDNCGTSADMLNITSATASAWPPAPGQSVTLEIAGALKEQVAGGTYSIQIVFDSFPVVNQQGDLTTIDKNITWPIQAGPFDLTQSLVLPSLAPAGTQVVVNASAKDTNGNELLCIGFALTIAPGAFDDVQQEQSEQEQDMFVPPAEQEGPHGAMASVARALDQLVFSEQARAQPLFALLRGEPVQDNEAGDAEWTPEDESEVAPQQVQRMRIGDIQTVLLSMFGDSSVISGKQMAPLTEGGREPIMVPFTSCANGTSSLRVISVSSTSWPPAPGTQGQLSAVLRSATGALSLNESDVIASVSIDGVTFLSGPVPSAAATSAASQDWSVVQNWQVPADVPFAGQVQQQLTVLDGACVQLEFDL